MLSSIQGLLPRACAADSPTHSGNRCTAKYFWLVIGSLLAALANGNTLAQHTPAGTTTEVLGTETAALIGGDLTDPEDDGDEFAGHEDPSWNWVSISASHEPEFEGAESAFNIFDNVIGGGNAKWCCDDPTPGNPVWVAVEFAAPVSLTHFTVTSGNDTPNRDPIDWAIQGSNDGEAYTDIYHFTGTPAIWTARNQVIRFNLPTPATAYRFIRYIAYDTPDPLHQINEIEYFALATGDRFVIEPLVPNYRRLTINIANSVGSAADPSTAVFTLNGQPATVTGSTNASGFTFTHTPAAPFAYGSQHTYTFEARDTAGNVVTSQGEFTIPSGYFPPENLPGPAPSGDQWAVRFVWNLEPGSMTNLVAAMDVLESVGTPDFTGTSADVTSPDIDFGSGGLFTQTRPFPAQLLADLGDDPNDFALLGIYQLVITNEADYTFGVHSDDGFGFRIRGAEAVSVSGNGQLDPNDAEAVVHPGTTGDSNTRAVYHLTPGTYRVEFVFFERGGGNHAEFYMARGAFTADTDPASWALVGSGIGPTPLFPSGQLLPSPQIVSNAWATRYIFGYQDTNGNLPQINSAALSLNIIRAVGSPDFVGSVVDVTHPVINFGGHLFGNGLPFPEEVTSDPNWTTEDFIQLSVGHIVVPEEGDYTVGVHSDDGFGLRIVGGEVVSVSGLGRIDIGSTDAVVHPGTTGDSNTRAVYHLKKGVYRVEFFWFERGGGEAGEIYVAKGAFVNDADTTTWMLMGDPLGGEQFTSLGLAEPGVMAYSSAPGGDPLNTWAEAFADLDATGGAPTNTYSVFYIGDPESNPGVQPFPKNTPAADDDFAVIGTATLVVPTSGTYVIGFNTDDGGYLRINGQTFIEIQPGANAASVIQDSGSGSQDELFCDCLTGDANTFATITLAAGNYPIEAGMFERGGGAYIRLRGGLEGTPTHVLPALSTTSGGPFTVPSSLRLTSAPTGIDDPGPGGDGPAITATRNGNNLTIQWAPVGGTLETTTSLSGTPTWTAVGTENPTTVQIGTGNAFYRVRAQ